MCTVVCLIVSDRCCLQARAASFCASARFLQESNGCRAPVLHCSAAPGEAQGREVHYGNVWQRQIKKGLGFQLELRCCV